MKDASALVGLVLILACVWGAAKSCGDSSAACSSAGKCWRGGDASCIPCEKIK